MTSLIKFGLLSLLASSALAVPHGTGKSKSKTKSSSVSAGPYALGNSTGIYAPTGTGTGVKSSTPTTTSTFNEDSSVGEIAACGTELTVTETAFQTITVSVTTSGSGADVGGQSASSTTAPYKFSNGTTSDVSAAAGPTGTGYASAFGSSVAHGHGGIHSARSSFRAAAPSSASAAASSYSSSLLANATTASSSTSTTASLAASTSSTGSTSSASPTSSASTTSSATAQAQATTTTTSAPVYALSSSSISQAASSSAAKSPSIKVDAVQAFSSTSTSASSSATPASGASKASGTGKRGLAYTDGRLTGVWPAGQISWGYNWSPNMAGLNSAFTHVPMLWGTRSVDLGPWKGLADAAVKNGVTHFLGFNEPNNRGQANMSPQDAAKAWRTYLEPYAKQGVKLGAPAIDNGPTGLQWLKDFMSACSDCTIDFVPFHWYDSCTNYPYFKSHVSDVYAAGGKRPLWLTEFAGNGDAAAQKTFLEKVMPWLDQNRQVERYSWFLVQDGSLMSGQQMSELGKTFATYTSDTIAKEMM